MIPLQIFLFSGKKRLFLYLIEYRMNDDIN